MKHEQNIREQGRIAKGLAADRRTLFEQVPFAQELERHRQDPERLAWPVVAVAGAYSAGKSALINALCGSHTLPVGITPTTLVPVLLRGGESASCVVQTDEGPQQHPPSRETLRRFICGEDTPARYLLVELPELAGTPWQWLDSPGVNTETQKQASGAPLQAHEVADHCLFVTSALQPLSLSDLTQLQQLSGSFPGDTLRIILTRCDQLSEEERTSVLDYVRKLLKEVLPQRMLQLVPVSSKTGEGISELRQALAEGIYRRQKEQLEAALKGWGVLLEDLRVLLEMRDLASLKPETLTRLRTRLDDLLVDESLQLSGDLSRFAEEVLRELTPALPGKQRHLTTLFREKLGARLESRLTRLHQRVNEELTGELRHDMKRETTVELANRFGPLLSDELFFDWRSAAKAGGLVSAGAALLMGAAPTPVGWALAGAALIGGLLGGIMGSASTLDTPDALRRLVVGPILLDAEQRLRQATQAARDDLGHLCTLLQKVAEVFSGPESGRYDVARLQQTLALARTRHEHLGSELREFHQKVELDRIHSHLYPPPPSPPAPPAPPDVETGLQQLPAQKQPRRRARPARTGRKPSKRT
jgi:GTP-binding protein EngB required for normal cell division